MGYHWCCGFLLKIFILFQYVVEDGQLEHNVFALRILCLCVSCECHNTLLCLAAGEDNWKIFSQTSTLICGHFHVSNLVRPLIGPIYGEDLTSELGREVSSKVENYNLKWPASHCSSSPNFYTTQNYVWQLKPTSDDVKTVNTSSTFSTSPDSSQCNGQRIYSPYISSQWLPTTN